MIADANGVESLAGIMGGEASGCDDTTIDVLVESALWDPLNIARSGRALGIVSDARYRFERGVDPDFCRPGLDLATAMILELCGGEASEMVFAGDLPESARVDRFPLVRGQAPDRARPAAGRDEAGADLARLPCLRRGRARAASRRRPGAAMSSGKADLVEEILRIAGLDRVASTPLPRIKAEVIKPVLTVLQKRTRAAKRLLASRGLVEAVTWSFISQDAAKLFGGGSPKLALANPIAADLSDMRPSLLPGLIRSAQANADRGFGDVALFEVGQVFLSDEPEGQLIAAAGLRRGTARLEGIGRHWDGAAKPVDAFDAKADVMGLLAGLGVAVGGLQIVAGGPAWAHPGRSATLQFGPKGVIGAFGEVHPKVLKALDVKGPLVAFEIHLDALPLPKYKPTKVKPKLMLSGFQPVTRDFAFIVDGKTVAAGDMAEDGAECRPGADLGCRACSISTRGRASRPARSRSRWRSRSSRSRRR